MQELIKQVQEACAAVCDKEYLVRKSAGNMHEENSEAQQRCVMAARAADNCAAAIRALDLSHLSWPRCACGDGFTEDALCANCLAAKDSASHLSRWQPIETAPKDGAPVLLLTPLGIIEGYFQNGHWRQKVARYDGNFLAEIGKTPISWMPLPTPPQPSK